LVAVVVDTPVFILTLLMVLVGVKRSLAVTVEQVDTAMLTLKLFLEHTALQSVAVVLAVLTEEVQLLELQQLVLV
jgi:hypothetical protein